MTPTLSHDQLQSRCFMWAWNAYPHLRKLFWHTPNELPRRPDEVIKPSMTTWQKQVAHRKYMMRLSQRKAIGVVPGVLDIVFYFHGVLHVFDFKVGSDTLSDDQKEFIQQVVDHGGKAYEINEEAQFQTIFKSILCQNDTQ